MEKKVTYIELNDDVRNENIKVIVDGEALNLDYCMDYTITRDSSQNVKIEFNYLREKEEFKKSYILKECDIQIIKKSNLKD